MSEDTISVEKVEKTAENIWDKYQKGVEHHNRVSLYAKTEMAFNFYEDRQWDGLESGGEELPFLNFIKTIVKYKTASIAMNDMSIVYTPIDNDELTMMVCDHFNAYAAAKWEELKMEKTNWTLIKNATIAGDCYAYFYNQGNSVSLIDNTDIYFADEQSCDIQDQKYIIVKERRFLEDVKEVARQCGLAEDDVDNIVADDAYSFLKNKTEVKGNNKVTVLLYMWKENEIVQYCRTTRTVIFEPETRIDGLDHYPIAGYAIEKLHNSCRGLGEVRPLIPNQIEINRNLVRRSGSIAITAFPKIVYDKSKITDIDALEKVGSMVEVNGMGAENVGQIVAYLNPSSISPDSRQFGEDMLNISKELAGAGDAALGQINPEQASGTAIMAVRDQSAIPLNESVSAYKQYVEDVANIWVSMYCAFHPDGLAMEHPEMGTVQIPTEQIPQLKVKVDVSPNNPFSKFAKTQSVDNLLSQQLITFDEYVEMLDEGSVLPKNKLVTLLERRAQNAMSQMPTGEENLPV